MLDTPPSAFLRPPSTVMRLDRMGRMFPTRLSFLRVLIRDLGKDRATLHRPVWSIDAHGYGHAVYSISLGGHEYSLVAVSRHLPDDQRTDRVIATAWDTSYVLYDGRPDATEIARICAEAPKQEAGRFTQRDLVLSRANKSVRLFSHVVTRLKTGQQPDAEQIRRVGYLMRTTAVYGNGKFGIADRAVYANRPGLSGPFAAEMLTIWLIRAFTHDLAEHLGGNAIKADLKRHLGIGNSTGLGMAPFLVSHPVLLHNWMWARETALARLRGLRSVSAGQAETLLQLAHRAARHLHDWTVPDPDAAAEIAQTRHELASLLPELEQLLCRPFPIKALEQRAAAMSVHSQELLYAMSLDPFGAEIDDLAGSMADMRGPRVPAFATLEQLRTEIQNRFGWALRLDFDDPEETRQFWYVSEEKLEPRIGLRLEEPGAELESPLDIARRVQALWRDLQGHTDLRRFRHGFPQHEMALQRVALAGRYGYGEIQDNLIASSCRPIDMLRCKLSFFGATKFDPKSDRWTRVTLAQGAPLPDEIGGPDADDWWLKGLRI